MTEYDTLKRLVAEAEEDVAKAIGGNKAAGTRVRKKMQEIKSAAQDVRKKILEGRDGEGAAGGAGGAAGGAAAGGGGGEGGGEEE
jgi:molecular chaperone DnaK